MISLKCVPIKSSKMRSSIAYRLKVSIDKLLCEFLFHFVENPFSNGWVYVVAGRNLCVFVDCF